MARKPPTWNRTRVFTVTVHSRNDAGGGSSTAYNNQLLFRDARPVTGAAAKGVGPLGPGGKPQFGQWLNPTPYRRGGYLVTTHPYRFRKRSGSLIPVNHYADATPVASLVGPGVAFAYHPLDAAMVPPPWTNGFNEAISRAKSKVNEAKVNYSLAVVEAHKSFRMIADKVVLLTRAVVAARRASLASSQMRWRWAERARLRLGSKYRPNGRRRGSREWQEIRKLRHRANSRMRVAIRDYRRATSELRQLGLGFRNDFKRGRFLLEYNYGWRPLMGDIFNACQQLSDGLGSPLASFYVTHKVTREVPDYPEPSGREAWQYTSSLKQTHKIRLDYGLDDANVAAMRARLTGLDNPFVLAWELIPYSFVVDWVVPIGHVLSGLTSSFGCKYRSGTHSNSVKGAHECQYYYYSGTLQPGGTPMRIGSKVFAVYRVTLSEAQVNLPRIYIKSPFARLSSGQLLNRLGSAAALLNQFQRR